MATRDDLVSAPRSGARPLFRGEPAPSKPPALTGRVVARRSGGSASASRQVPRSAANSTPGGTSGRASTSSASTGRTEPRRSSGLRVAQGAARAATSTPDFKNYQGIILAEFVVAELLVAGTPIATRQNKQGLSPYVARDMTKLLSLGLVYFLLELMAVGGPKAGRLGAWFGGLILIAVGLNEGTNVAKVLDIFGGGGSSSSSSDSGSASDGSSDTSGQNPLTTPSGLVQRGGSSSFTNPNQALGR